MQIGFFLFYGTMKEQKSTMELGRRLSMNAKEFGERISALRKKQGLTQLQLAEKLNVSNKTISRWETGGSLS